MSGLAAVGSHGRNTKQMQSPLLRLFGRPRGAPDFTWVPVPSVRGTVFHPVLLPHEFSGRLYAERRDIFDASVRGPVEASSTFWNALRGSSIVANNAALNADKEDITLPLGLHGDGGAFSKHDSLFVISWNSLLGSLGGSGFARRFLFTIVRKRDQTPGTLDAFVAGVCMVCEPSVDWYYTSPELG